MIVLEDDQDAEDDGDSTEQQEVGHPGGDRAAGTASDAQGNGGAGLGGRKTEQAEPG